MPRIVKPTTDTEIKNSKPKEKDYKISDGQGLYLLIKKSGSKIWRFDFSYGGKRQSMSFGSYPLVSLKTARMKRDEAREQLANNKNPIAEKKSLKSSEKITLNIVIKEWLELRQKSASSGTITSNKRILKNLTNFLGNFSIKDIKRSDIIKQLQKVQDKGKIETAHRLYSLINKVYMYAVTNEYVTHNIIADIDKKIILVPKNNDNHHPAITNPVEVKKLLLDLDRIGTELKSDISTIHIFKILPYVFVRSDNLRLMEWNELDLDNSVWCIPKEKMKTRIDFVCPLPIQAIRIIEDIKPYSFHRSKFVFPSPLKKDRGVAGSTLSTTLNNLGYKDKHCVHGFRSIFSTNAHELRKEHTFDSEIIELCLAHKEKNRVKSAYDRASKYKYIEEKKELLQWYADWLDKIKVS